MKKSVRIGCYMFIGGIALSLLSVFVLAIPDTVALNALMIGYVSFAAGMLILMITDYD